MKILGISGGTKNGANDSMCKEALIGAKEVGAEVEFIHLMDLDIKYCTGCTTCVQSLFSGKGNMCVLNDDFDWLLDKMLDADGIVFATPIFEKGASGLFHTITDRFGPRMDRGNNVIATKMAEEGHGKPIDPRIIKDKVISFMGIGGSDWMTRVQCDMAMLALTPMWKIIENEVFPWSLGIIADDEKVARAHKIGRNLALAAVNFEKAEYLGEEGVCPHCHSRNFFLSNDSTKAICCLCGIEGDVKIVDNKVCFVFPEEQLEHAHDTLPGKFKHANDIKNNTLRYNDIKKSDDYKKRIKKYKEFIEPLKPHN